jgi:hypothetical protein
MKKHVQNEHDVKMGKYKFEKEVAITQVVDLGYQSGKKRKVIHLFTITYFLGV